MAETSIRPSVFFSTCSISFVIWELVFALLVTTKSTKAHSKLDNVFIVMAMYWYGG